MVHAAAHHLAQRLVAVLPHQEQFVDAQITGKDVSRRVLARLLFAQAVNGVERQPALRQRLFARLPPLLYRLVFGVAPQSK